MQVFCDFFIFLYKIEVFFDEKEYKLLRKSKMRGAYKN